jgi:ubiquinol-cytochrome c reductase cytochrome b subunit
MFGISAVAGIVVLFVTGVFLMFVYVPSSEQITYQGPYEPLEGASVSSAFASVMRISFEVPGGLLIRQMHHWAALLVPALIILQLLVTFFTGGFRRPRRTSWALLFLLLAVVLVGGWSGYALPDDMLSGSGLRIAQGIMLGIPVIGTRLSMFVFGGQFPGTIIENIFPIHVLIVPAVTVVLIGWRAWLGFRRRPAQFAGWGRREANVVGIPLLPSALARAGGLFLITVGLLVLIAATAQTTPVWAYGPSDPGNATAGSQPDWYMGFLDGALRLVPPGWEFVWLGRTWTLAVLVPLAVVGVFLLLVALYPFLEEWIAKDKDEHHILDRPRNAPTRTGIGVAGIVFYGVLWLTANADIIALVFQLTIEGVITTMQITLLIGPGLAFVVTRRICIALQEKDRDLVLHGSESGRIVRLASGEYVEVHQPLPREERERLTAPRPTHAVGARPNEAGRLTHLERARGRLASWFFDDRTEPVRVLADACPPERALEQAEPELRERHNVAPRPVMTSARSVPHIKEDE